jgi:DNA-binding CsgD family transcriptional regulator
MGDEHRGKAGMAAGGSAAELVHALGERVKELQCLYGIARLAEGETGDLDRFLRGVVRLLPPAWQYPETAGAGIRYRGRRYRSPRFVESRWRQSADIVVRGAAVGDVVVCYREPRPASHEGPFLREERALIDAVADYVGAVARRIEAERELAEANRVLTVERESLREANVALRAVLARAGEEKAELGREIGAQVDRVLLPILNALALELPPRARPYVDLLRRNLLDVTSPYAARLASVSPALSPAETAVCSMVRGGLRTKEIARLRGVSAATVSRHREHIRRKLGLAGRKINLSTWLAAAAGTAGASEAAAAEPKRSTPNAQRSVTVGPAP